MKHITKILLGFACGVFLCVAPGIANAQDDCQNCKDLFNDIGTDPNLCDLMSSPKDKCANVTDNTLLSICMDSVEDWCSAYRKDDTINADDFCQDTTYCTGGGTGGGGTGGGGSNTCPSDCTRPSVTYQELGNDIVKVSTRYCDASTNYVCRTKTENITLLTEKQFDTATVDCVTGNCMDWDCVWTEGVGTTCRAGGNNQPFCMCALYNGNYLKTVAVRLGCNSTTNTGYNCNGIASADDASGSPLYCDLTASTSAGAGVCRYKKTCSTDCTSTNTNAWNVTGHVQRKEYLYRLKRSCDYTTGSCVSASGTVVSDFDYKCNHDNRAYETAPEATCTRMRSGKPGTCNGCSVCDTTANAWENVSGNPAYQQQYHYNFSPISGTDRYQCVKTMDSQYRCNAGYYGNSGSSMTGCNACPTLEQSNLTIVSQNDACDGYHFVYTDTAGATSINDCYASTGNDGTDTSYCVAKMSDGTGTFYWSYNDAVMSTGNCNWQ